jgi:phytoene desaturase
MKAIVIGSGFGGLGVANRLAAKGHEVEIFDNRDQLGGRAYQYQINGFKFDGGPTVITAPYMFDELFDAVGKRRQDYLQLVPLDPFYRIFNHEGKSFDYRHTLEDTLKEIEKWSPADKEGFVKFNNQTRGIFDRFHPFTDQPFMTIQDMARIIPDVIRLRAFLGYYGFSSMYIKDQFLRRVFSFHPLLIGGNPFDTPSIFSLIVQFERKWGVHYAIGGTGAIVEALGRLFVEQGGKVNLNTEVKEILVKGRRATGIRLADGTIHKADVIISNGDVAHTYRYLIPEQYRKKFTNARIDRLKYSMSLFVIYFGTKRQYRNDSVLLHHNIILNERYKGLLTDIFNRNVLPEDFSLYLHMPTITDPSIAPEGSESFYVLSCVPTLQSGTDWTKIARPYRDRIMKFLEENYLPDLQQNIIAEHYIDPLHFQTTLNSYRGAAFSVRPTLLQEAYFRPHNRSEDFENLFFVGAGTHPGAGVPAVLSSGKIAANLIDPNPFMFTTRTDIDREMENMEPTPA